MKYMLLMSGRQGDWSESGIGTWDPEEVKAHTDFMRLIGQELTESGELAGGEGLAPPEQAKVVRAQSDGSPAVTDGLAEETVDSIPTSPISPCTSNRSHCP